jgi:large subunit ribosomal protein LP0
LKGSKASLALAIARARADNQTKEYLANPEAFAAAAPAAASSDAPAAAGEKAEEKKEDEEEASDDDMGFGLFD